jgi:peptide/nickel transport system substrate-binding protein
LRAARPVSARAVAGQPQYPPGPSPLTGSFGNAATRIETFVASGGTYVYGGYLDIDGLFRDQAGELDRKRRVAESGLGLITGWAFSAPYEDVKLKGT